MGASKNCVYFNTSGGAAVCVFLGKNLVAAIYVIIYFLTPPFAPLFSVSSL